MDTSTVTAADIMTRQLAVTTPETHVMDAIQRMIAQRVSGLPVIDGNGHFAGRFCERSAVAALDLAKVEHDSHAANELRQIRAADIMDRPGFVLQSNQDVFESAGQLIAGRVSGAPVIDADGTLRGVFSERSAMHVFIGLCWEQLPSSRVTAWLDRHDDRVISEETTLEEILSRFQNTAYRRLIVVHGPKLVGQITRRDTLRAIVTGGWAILGAWREAYREEMAGRRSDPGNQVSGWMDHSVNCTGHDADVLAIAQQFLRTEARQLPVLDGRRLNGQISRSDLLRAIQKFFPDNASSDSGARPLYLTSVNKHDAASVMK